MIAELETRTETELGVNLEEYQTLITKYARVAFGKLKKPALLSVDDLIQEGFIALIYCKKYYRQDSKAQFKTYFIRSLVNQYYTLIEKSYRSINQVEEEKEVYENRKYGKTPDFLHYTDLFTKEETQYILFSLSPSKEIRRRFRTTPRKVSLLIQEGCKWSSYQELNIRRSIQNKIKGLSKKI